MPIRYLGGGGGRCHRIIHICQLLQRVSFTVRKLQGSKPALNKKQKAKTNSHDSR